MAGKIRCMSGRRPKNNLRCRGCPVGYHFVICSLDSIDVTADEMLKVVRKFRRWRPHLKTGMLLRQALMDACLESIEQGILKISFDQKKKLVKKLGGGYEEYLKKTWDERRECISISLCVNEKRALLGVHDEDAGYSIDESDYSPITDRRIPERGTRKRGVLEKFGLSLYRNREGNSILCTFNIPEAQENGEIKGETP